MDISRRTLKSNAFLQIFREDPRGRTILYDSSSHSIGTKRLSRPSDMLLDFRNERGIKDAGTERVFRSQKRFLAQKTTTHSFASSSMHKSVQLNVEVPIARGFFVMNSFLETITTRFLGQEFKRQQVKHLGDKSTTNKTKLCTDCDVYTTDAFRQITLPHYSIAYTDVNVDCIVTIDLHSFQGKRPYDYAFLKVESFRQFSFSYSFFLYRHMRRALTPSRTSHIAQLTQTRL